MLLVITKRQKSQTSKIDPKASSSNKREMSPETMARLKTVEASAAPKNT